MNVVNRPSRWVILARYVAGRPLDGRARTDCTFLQDGVISLTPGVRVSRWALLAGWKRTLVRMTAPPGAVVIAQQVAHDPALWGNSAGAAGVVLAGRGAAVVAGRVRYRRFRRVYLRPLARTIGPAIGEPPSVPDRWLTVSRDLAGLQARLVRPMSPAQVAVRDWYGRRLEPGIRWLPEHLMRAYWGAHDAIGPVRNQLDRFRIAREPLPARVEIRARSGYVGPKERELIRAAVPVKLGLGDLVESWDMVGPVAVGTYTVRERPPSKVGFEDIRPHLEGLGEAEFIAGLTTGSRPVIISLDDDAPHIACSAGSGAGKSVLAKLLAAQVLRRGGRVLILDRKGSHRWARDLDGVNYCTRPEDMHHALIATAQLADQRNEQAMTEDEGWVPGHRVFVIFEEMNATVAQLRQWWEENREKGQPKISPAISAFRNIMFMGRSAWVNLFGVAQMLTSNTTGGPESRENFGIRALARYSANNWKMLAPECPMPRKSKTRGRWQFVIAGEATEVQVAFLTDPQVWELIGSVPVSPGPQAAPTQGVPTGTPVDGDNLETMREIVERVCPGAFETVKKRRSRARAKGEGPRPRGQRGRAEVYDRDEFTQWLTSVGLVKENGNVG